MGDHKDLSNKEAVSKIKEIVISAETCMFTTDLNEAPLQTRPMGTLDVDDAGNIWFFSSSSSGKNKDILYNNKVQLFYSNKSGAEYLSVYGQASIIIDKEMAQRLWTPIAKAWFKNGADDPDLTIIKVRPIKAHYWDTKNNKMVSLFKIFTSAFTETVADDSIEGNIIF
ncbi:MAG TPA: pyridoxamine 5'-phosphate oxidase family protein [Ferruginibacter sp.]|nr:pyridoxamine 5'-phosphate oxidase family protein [Ferruginibacter sp.]